MAKEGTLKRKSFYIDPDALRRPKRALRVRTDVYVDHWEGVLDDKALAQVRSKFVVRQSSVVLSELRR